MAFCSTRKKEMIERSVSNKSVGHFCKKASGHSVEGLLIGESREEECGEMSGNLVETIHFISYFLNIYACHLTNTR